MHALYKLLGERAAGTEGMKKISIITPIFHGKKYINGIIAQVEKCQEALNGLGETELLIINDDPSVPVSETDYKSEHVAIRIFNPGVNRGIHGARVYGVNVCSGEYLVFLDQDDILYPDYIKSQMLRIGDADAVVCRCIHEKKQFYNADMRFEDVVSAEYMMTRGNPVISAGQVMLRKGAIPKVWMTNIMKTNCADDYLLWLSMLAQNAVFSLNQDIVFEHTVNGENLSLDYKRMILSLDEMYDILAENKVFDKQKLCLISAMRQNALSDWIALLEKFREMFLMLNRIAIYREHGSPLGKQLRDRGIRRVAVYGDGYLGKRLMGELKEYQIKTAFFIDRNADYLQEEVPVYKLEDAPDGMDAVLISLVRNYDEVKRSLQKKYHVAVYTMKDILEGV